MKTLNDIFVPYKIAEKLKEIGFDEPCIGYYEKDNPNVRLNEKTQGTIKHNGLLIYISAPTWEQVKKWFREKDLESSLFTEDGYYYYRGSKGNKFLFSGTENTYEQAREALILKLIKIYKNEQDI